MEALLCSGCASIRFPGWNPAFVALLTVKVDDGAVVVLPARPVLFLSRSNRRDKIRSSEEMNTVELPSESKSF